MLHSWNIDVMTPLLPGWVKVCVCFYVVFRPASAGAALFSEQEGVPAGDGPAAPVSVDQSAVYREGELRPLREEQLELINYKCLIQVD